MSANFNPWTVATTFFFLKVNTSLDDLLNFLNLGYHLAIPLFFHFLIQTSREIAISLAKMVNLGKKIQNCEKGPKMGQKQGFFNLLGNLGDNFY